MRKTCLITAMSMLAGCVHTTPNPVPIAQPGDEKMSCRSIENEMQDMQNQRMQSDSAGDGQVAKNVGLGVAGALLIVPWFFMDTSDAHSVEAKAAQARYKRLQAMYWDKQCTPPGSGQTIQPAAAPASPPANAIPNAPAEQSPAAKAFQPS